MRAATVITARLGSSRLPRKMLADLGGATVLERLVKRVSKAKRPEVVVLATTQEPEDDELTSAAEALGISVFRGSTHDVLVRWRDAAAAYGADLLVNCDGDDVFCDPPHIDRIIETYEQTGAEYIVCAGLPFGAAPTGIAASGLERVCERKLEDNTEGQGRFFAVPGIVSKAEVAAPAELGHATARMTLDYPEDLDFFSAVVSELQAGDEPPPLEQIVALLRARPDIVAINSGMQERYWQRFNALYQPVQLDRAHDDQAGEMSREPRVKVGGRTIGRGEPVFIVAEAGVNHDGDLETALELVDAAAEAGADAVKFQTFDPDQLVSSGSGLASYQRRGVDGGNGQKEMLSRLRFGKDEHAAIVEHSRKRGIVFLSTPFDDGSAALLARLGVPAFKVGSGELTNLPFLTELTRYSLPILLSTGMSDLDEVRAAVETIRAHGVPLVLFHCVSSYPAPETEANLRAIDAMREAFGVPVGYSDHCLGFDVSLAAVARDACILERHLTLDRERPGPDHAMSMEPDELGELVKRVRALELTLGDGRKRPQPSEEELRIVARRSIVAARPLAAGETLTADSLAIKRPGGGLAPDRLSSLVGARVTKALAADEQLTEAHIVNRR